MRKTYFLRFLGGFFDFWRNETILYHLFGVIFSKKVPYSIVSKNSGQDAALGGGRC